MVTGASEDCDLLIEAGLVVPVEPHGVVLEDHAVAIRAGAIVAVLPVADARRRFQATQTVSRPDGVLIPGLVNAHVHNPMTLLRGGLQSVRRTETFRDYRRFLTEGRVVR